MWCLQRLLGVTKVCARNSCGWRGEKRKAFGMSFPKLFFSDLNNTASSRLFSHSQKCWSFQSVFPELCGVISCLQHLKENVVLRRLRFCLLSLPPTNWLDNEQIFFLCSSISKLFDLQAGRAKAARGWQAVRGDRVVGRLREPRSGWDCRAWFQLPPQFVPLLLCLYIHRSGLAHPSKQVGKGKEGKRGSSAGQGHQ